MSIDSQIVPPPDADSGGLVQAQEAPREAQANPLVVMHSLLRGRYPLAIALAIVGAAIGGPLGYLLPQPEFRSMGVIQIDPNVTPLLYKTDQNGIMPMFESFLASHVAQFKNRRVIDAAMLDPKWKALNRGLQREAVAEFQESLEVVNPRNSPLIQVSFTDRDPNAAAVAVNAVLAAYWQIYVEPAADTQRLTTLTNLKETYEGKVKSNTLAIHDVDSEYADTSLPSVYERKLQQLSMLEARLMNVQIDVSLAGGHRGEPRADMPTTRSADDVLALRIAQDPKLQRLDLERDAHDREKRRLQSVYGDEHRLVQDVARAIQLIDQDMKRRTQELRQAGPLMEVAVARQSGGQTLAQLMAAEAMLEKLFADTKRELQALKTKNQRIIELNIEGAEYRELLADTKKKLQQLTIEQSNPERARLSKINDAEVPLVPSKDRRKALAAVGGMGMAGIGVGFVMLLGFLDRRLRHIDTARSRLSHIDRLLGVVPELPKNLADPEQAEATAYCVHHIRAMLQIRQRASGRKIFAITSPGPGEGKTSLTVSLGMSMAASGSNTLVLDCDFEGGGLSSRLRPSNGQSPPGASPGLVGALRGTPLDEAILPTGIPMLSILPLGALPRSRGGQLSPDQLRKLLDLLSSRFDTVLADCGPILGSVEASIVAAGADSVILLVSRETDRNAAQRAARFLRDAGAEVEGIVFNRAGEADIATSAYSSSASMRSTRATNASAVVSVGPDSDRTGGAI